MFLNLKFFNYRFLFRVFFWFCDLMFFFFKCDIDVYLEDVSEIYNFMYCEKYKYVENWKMGVKREWKKYVGNWNRCYLIGFLNWL